MITEIALTEAGISVFNSWFDATAKPGTRREGVLIELLAVIHKRVESGDELVYELQVQDTASGRPELLTLSAEDIDVIDKEG